MKMSSKKKIAAVAITVAALSMGSVGIASADHAGGKGAMKSTVLAELVKAGTITQVQADAITKKFDDAKATMQAAHAANQAEHQADRAAREALVSTTIGVDAATIKTRMAAGETLATIAGAKKDALIAALVAFQSKEIDDRVAAGKLTAEQATTIKANLTAHITAEVNEVHLKGLGSKGDMGNHGKNKGGKGKRN